MTMPPRDRARIIETIVTGTERRKNLLFFMESQNAAGMEMRRKVERLLPGWSLAAK